MLRVTRCTLAAAFITLALGACQDAARPPSSGVVGLRMSLSVDKAAPLIHHIVAPQTTDPAIDRALDDHYVWLDTAARSDHKLLVFMPSANALPGQFQLVEQEAARLGYHVIGLMYPNSVNLVMACGGASDPNACFEAARLEILDGIERSPVVDVNETNSIDNRLTKLLTRPCSTRTARVVRRASSGGATC